jgi:glucosamine--fructose-6-phosphate aminotransferase (isomerizing)
VKSLGKFPDSFLAEIAGQPAAVRRAAAGLAEQQAEMERLRSAARDAQTIVFTGMGSSYDACYSPVTQLASQGVRASMVDSAELLHFRLAAIGADTLLVAVSQSGESAELVRLTEALTARPAPGRPVLLSVTNGVGNTLARAADIALDTRAGEEHGPSTMTFAAALVALCAVAGDGVGAAAAADALDELLESPEEDAAGLVEWFGDRPVLALLGRGCARAAAEMGALTLKEAAQLPAESLQTAQFRHGPLELAGGRLAAMVFATEPRTRHLDLGLAGELVAAGSPVLVVSQDGEAPSGARGLAVGPLAAGIAPAVAILPAQLLAWRLAAVRGRTPGEFSIAAKVTTRE